MMRDERQELAQAICDLIAGHDAYDVDMALIDVVGMHVGWFSHANRQSIDHADQIIDGMARLAKLRVRRHWGRIGTGGRLHA